MVPSIGALWTGKLGNKPICNNLNDIAEDVVLLLGCGFNRIFVYNLEGIVNRNNPEFGSKK